MGAATVAVMEAAGTAAVVMEAVRAEAAMWRW